jgi:NAD(P)H dehydrogenase (quinone)
MRKWRDSTGGGKKQYKQQRRIRIMDLVIFAHPDDRNSHNARVLKYVQNRLRASGRAFETLNLYKEKFDPLVKVIDEVRGDGTRYSKEMAKYQDLIAKAERLVFIYPAWWYNMPAILLGFVDRTFTSGFAYDLIADGKGGSVMQPRLKGKTAVVISTYGFGRDRYERHGRASEIILDRTVLEDCGIRTTRVNWFDVRPGIGMPEGTQKEIDAALS